MISFRTPHSLSARPRWRGWLLPLLLSLLLACSLSTPAAWSQPVDDAATADQRLDGLRKQITSIQKALDGDADRLQMVDAQGRLYNGDELLYLMVMDRLATGPVAGAVGLAYADGHHARHVGRDADQPLVPRCVRALGRDDELDLEQFDRRSGRRRHQ